MKDSVIDQRIIDFIRKHHIFTIATCLDQKPYCATCFYAYLKEQNMLVFTSSEETEHAQEMLKQPNVAGAIALETMVVGKIQGVQFTGQARKLEGEEKAIAEHIYMKRFPVARLMDTVMWGLTPDFLKMTHNMLGFGTKLIWKKS